MKKILLTTMCSLLALTAMGCSSTNETQVLNNLSTKLDRVSTIVSNTSTTEVNSVSPLEIEQYQQSNPNYMQSVRRNAYNNMVREEELRQGVLSTSSYLKSSIDKKYKLGKSKTMALMSLTDSLETYISNLAGTKLSVKNTVNKIQRYTNIQNIDINRTRVSYNELNNLMQARATYLANLQNTMYEICDILNESVVQENNAQTNKTNTNNVKNNTIRRNIDTYNNKIDKKTTNSENEINDEVVNTSYEYPNNPYNNYYNNNYYNNYYNRDYRFNPNRNTDTFYPRVKNIDTYRFNPNYNGNPYYNYGYGYNGINNTLPANSQKDNIDDCENCVDNDCKYCEYCNGNGCEHCQNCENGECKECLKLQDDNKIENSKQNKVISISDDNVLDANYLDEKFDKIEK